MSSRAVTQSYGCLIHLAGASSDRQARQPGQRADRMSVGAALLGRFDAKEPGSASAPLPRWRWHLDEVFVKINGKLRYLWRAVDHEGEVLETVVTAKRFCL